MLNLVVEKELLFGGIELNDFTSVLKENELLQKENARLQDATRAESRRLKNLFGMPCVVFSKCYKKRTGFHFAGF